MVSTLLSSTDPLSVVYDVLLLDLDGTTYVGKAAAPHAPEALLCAKNHGARTMYLTNNSGRSEQVVAEHLLSLGIDTQPDEVINSSYVAARVAENLLPAGAKVLLVGAQGLHDAFEHTQLQIVASADDAPDAVVQGLDEQSTWASLSEAVLALTTSAKVYIATNLDATLPKERGAMIGNGSFVACIENATGVKAINCGKPEPTMYQLGVQRTHAHKPLSVGDRLDTDIAGAVAAGYHTMHVLTGVTQPQDVMLAKPQQRPSFVGIDLSDLNYPHPGVQIVNSADIAHPSMREYLHAGDTLRTDLAHAQPDMGSDAEPEIFRCEDAYAYIDCSADVPVCVLSDVNAELVRINLDSGAVLRDSTCATDQGAHHQGDHSCEHTEKTAHKGQVLSISLLLYRAATCALWNACDTGMISRERVSLPKMHAYRLPTAHAAHSGQC